MKMKLKKMISFFAGVNVALNAFALPVYAYSVPDEVRVGLEYKYKDSASVPITNTEIGIGTQRGSSFFPSAVLSSPSGFTMRTGSGYYIGLDHTFASYEKALDCAQDMQRSGMNAYPAFLGNDDWSVYVTNISSFSEAKNMEALAENASGYGASAEEADSKSIELWSGTSPCVIMGNGIWPQIMAADNNGIITLSDRSYRGRIEFGRYTGGLITAVNVVSLDEYLYGVVPSEMPSSYEEEALEAQAVAARTYAVSRIGVHAASGYDLCDNTNCQVYIGYNQEKATTNKAVDATRGVMIYYEGTPINAVFSASSGGYTDDSENVWNNMVPYLRAVPEINEVDTNTWTRTFTLSDITDILNSSGANIGAATDIVISNVAKTGRIQEIQIVGTSGVKVLTKEDIKSFFSPKGGSLESRMFQINGVGSGTASGASVKKNTGGKTNSSVKGTDVYITGGETDNIMEIEDAYVIGASGEARRNDEDSVSVIGAGDAVNVLTAGGSSGAPASSGDYSFTANPVTGSSTGSTVNASGIFVIEGRGSGHGVGMSQKGARGMAQLGYSYRDILFHYYTGVVVE